MKSNKLIFFVSAVLCFAGDKKLTLEDVSGKSPFKFASLGRYTWIPDEDAYIIQHDGALKKVDLLSGDTTLFLDSTAFMLADPDFVQAPWRPGFTPSTLYFSKDGSKILFLSDREQIWRRSFYGTFWVIHLESGEIQPVSKNNSDLRNVKFSPDGNKVAYVRKDNNIYVYDLTSKKERRLTRTGSDEILNGHWGWVYEEEFGSFDGYRWSPDSKLIAFWEEDQSEVPIFNLIHELDLYPTLEQVRYPKAGETNPTMRIAVVSVRGGRTKWIDIGDNHDTYYPWMKWTNDNELTIMRMKRQQNFWEFLVVPTSRGKIVSGLTEEDSSGWVDLHRNYKFLEDGNILWISERSGWNHIYIHSKNGNLIKQITDGNWEVSRIVHVDEENRTVYFMANKENVRESRFYSVDFDGRNMTLLTPEKGSHWISISPTKKYFIDSYSCVTQPRKIVLKNMDGSTVRILKETDRDQFEEYDWSTPEFVHFKTDDDSDTLDGILTLPVGYEKGKKYPIIVHGYGMPGTQIVRNRWGGTWNQFLAQEGYAIFSIDARGMSGRGETFKNLSYLDMAKYLAKDTATGVKYLVYKGIADPDRIGAWGWSGGGYFTGLMLTKNAHLFDVGVAVAPVMDFRLYDTIYTERSMGLPQENKEGYDSASVFSYVDRFKGKMLVIHGTGDDNVHSQNTTQLAEEFIKAGKQLDVFYYPGRRHGISRNKARPHLYRKMWEYFKENL